jgi:hypothetical protein
MKQCEAIVFVCVALPRGRSDRPIAVDELAEGVQRRLERRRIVPIDFADGHNLCAMHYRCSHASVLPTDTYSTSAKERRGAEAAERDKGERQERQQQRVRSLEASEQCAQRTRELGGVCGRRG